MAKLARLAVAVLAAGSSRRFGDKDKLIASFRGMPLGIHATVAIPAASFTHRFVIAPSVKHPLAEAWIAAGFDVHPNPHAAAGMGTSVALAARLARQAKADALMVVLADMPLVPPEHLAALAHAARHSDPEAIIVSTDGTTRSPPAVFGSAHFDALSDLSGDTGARALLAKGAAIECPPDWLIDIDTPEALAAQE